MHFRTVDIHHTKFSYARRSR